MKTKPTILIALTAIFAALVLPAYAAAEYLVPEGNSAVNQYTEGYPTAGGEKGSDSGKETEKVKPGKTIGAGNAKKLEDKGPEGTAVAEVAAETAPPDVTVPNDSSGNQSGQGKGNGKGDKNGQQGDGAKNQQGDDNGGESEEGSAAVPAGSDNSGSGSSGLGELVSAATGTESGHLGMLLPLVILAAIAWAFAFAWRQRKRPTAQ
jgi:hypothetical protein